MRFLTPREFWGAAQNAITVVQGVAAKLKAKALALKRPFKAQEKAEKRLQNILERQVEKNLKAAEKLKYFSPQEPSQTGDIAQAELGPSTSFQPSRSLSPPPLGGEPSMGTRPLSTPTT